MVKRLFSRTRLDQIFVQFVQYGFVSDQLTRLIIHHENVDLLMLNHFLPSLRLREIGHKPRSKTKTREPASHSTDGTTFAMPRAIAPYSRVLPDILTHRLRDISRDRLSWLSQSKLRLAIAGTKD